MPDTILLQTERYSRVIAKICESFYTIIYYNKQY